MKFAHGREGVVEASNQQPASFFHHSFTIHMLVDRLDNAYMNVEDTDMLKNKCYCWMFKKSLLVESVHFLVTHNAV